MERTRAGSVSTRGRVASGLLALVAAAAVLGACTAPAATSTPATAAPATNAPATGVTLEVRQDATLGAFVAGADGMSLYVFANDTNGTSTCTADCAGSWPPLTVANAADAKAGTGVTGAIGTTARADGTLQVTLGGAPLYYFAADTAAGDTKGQGVGGVWFLASPAGEQVGGGGAASPGGSGPAETECDNPSCY